MKPRHTAEQSTVKVNKSEDITQPTSVPVDAAASTTTTAPAAAPQRRGFGGLAPKADS
jgi:ribonucleoside-diphosphate reductase alpha chain